MPRILHLFQFDLRICWVIQFLGSFSSCFNCCNSLPSTLSTLRAITGAVSPSVVRAMPSLAKLRLITRGVVRQNSSEHCE